MNKIYIHYILACTILISLPPLEASSYKIENINFDFSVENREQFCEPLDIELLTYAEEKLKDIYVAGKHFVVAAVRTKSGGIFTGFNIKTTATRSSICAEGVVIAKAIEAKDSDFDTLLVIAYLPEKNGESKTVIVSPCGICRELLYDFATDANIILTQNGNLVKIPVRDLLVFPYKR